MISVILNDNILDRSSAGGAGDVASSGGSAVDGGVCERRRTRRLIRPSRIPIRLPRRTHRHSATTAAATTTTAAAAASTARLFIERE